MPKSIDALPQSGRWQLYVHKLRAWIPGDDEQPVRPYLMLVVSTDDGAFLACEPGDTPEDASGGNVVKEKPTAETVFRSPPTSSLHFFQRPLVSSIATHAFT